MSSHWKKVWADLCGNKSPTLLTILMIKVCMFAVGFNRDLALYLTESMDDDGRSASPSEAQIYACPIDDDTRKYE